MKWKSSQQDIPFHRLWKKLLPASFFFSSSWWMFLALFWSCRFFSSFHQMINSKAKTFVLSSNQIRSEDPTGLWKHVFLLWLNNFHIFHTLDSWKPAVGNLRCHSFFFFRNVFTLDNFWLKNCFLAQTYTVFKLLLSCIAPKKYLFCRL